MPDKQWWKCLSWKCTFHVIFRQFRRVACCWQSQQRSSARDVLSKGRTSGSAITQKGREGDLCSPAASQQARPLQLSLKEASLFHVSYFFFCFPFYRHFSWIFFHFFKKKRFIWIRLFFFLPFPTFSPRGRHPAVFPVCRSSKLVDFPQLWFLLTCLWVARTSVKIQRGA